MNEEKSQKLQVYAKQMRREMPPGERKLWYCFLKQYPVKFYKQKIIGDYIADFYCHTAKLVVEADGSQHYEPAAEEYDKKRTAFFEENGIRVLRFSNREINLYFREVCDSIHHAVCVRTGSQE